MIISDLSVVSRSVFPLILVLMVCFSDSACKHNLYRKKSLDKQRKAAIPSRQVVKKAVNTEPLILGADRLMEDGC